MKWIWLPLRLLWKIWFLLYMLFSTIVLYPFLLITVVLFKNYPLTFHTVYKIWSWSICIAIGVLPVLKNRHKLPARGNYVMISNHTSQLDIVLPYTKMGKYFAFLAKEELKNTPLFKTNFRGMNITVNRKDMISGLGALKACAEKLKSGANLLIFPEGTRSKTAPVMRPFKQGPFKLAIENKVPIVPVVFLDNYKRLEGGDVWFGSAGPGISRMIVLDPIMTNDLTASDVKALINQSEQAINGCLKDYNII